MLEYVGLAFVIFGAVFVFISALGMWRLPDVFTRLHAAGITDSLGAPLLILGLALLSNDGLVAGKYILLLVFALVTSATACHALAKAALIEKTPVGKILAKPKRKKGK